MIRNPCEDIIEVGIRRFGENNASQRLAGCFS
jgi:hypothetical protein